MFIKKLVIKNKVLIINNQNFKLFLNMKLFYFKTPSKFIIGTVVLNIGNTFFES